MIDLLDVERLGYQTLTMPSMPAASDDDSLDCPRCIAHRPAPRLDGDLQVDPEIDLPSPGMDVDISYYYNASDSYNGPYGYGRTISHNLRAVASGSPTIVTLTRGTGAKVSFQDDGFGNFIASTPGVLNSLVKDVPNSLWKETTLDGFVTAYPLDTAGNITSATYIADAVGNRHTLSYSSGRLATLQDAVGRLVSFSYNASNVLETIKDWAGRVTTFQYDTASVPAKPLLTTVIGPTGCQTVYQYASFTLDTAVNPDGYGWLLSQITDPNGYATSYTYDRHARVKMREVVGTGITTYLYQPGTMLVIDSMSVTTTQNTNASFDLTSSVDAIGGVRTFTYNGQRQPTATQNPLGAITTRSYDAKGNLTSVQDALGYIMTTQYDAYNNPTTITYADGSIVSMVWGYGGSSFDTTGAKCQRRSKFPHFAGRKIPTRSIDA